MGRSEGRGPSDTKRLIMSAASAIIREKGLSATLDDIAFAAGVSKGGLVYHYKSKHALILALGNDLVTGFNDRVEAHLKEDDTGAGRVARAYIRASFQDLREKPNLSETIALMTTLMTEPGVKELARKDAQAWRTALIEDGLPPATIALIVSSVEGISSVPSWASVLDATDVIRLEETLIAMTREPGVVANLAAESFPSID